MILLKKKFIFNILIFCFEINFVISNEETQDVHNVTDSGDTKTIAYLTPKVSSDSYFFESFDEKLSFEKRWVRSSAKKDDVDDNIAKYDGIWSVEPLKENSLQGDEGLVLKSKAKHAAISAKLSKPFYFREKPFIVQYEVNLQNGQECGGAYIKLLSEEKSLDLNRFNDKTPYTIMFGPDKCGNDFKVHFIFRHVNPVTKIVNEKHCKKSDGKIEQAFKDKKTHLYTLILRPDNSFEILFDHQVVNSGHLLEDFTPPVNPPKEIDDVNDIKPHDWDEREKIPNPNAVKPDDWDENAPKQIIDHFADKPEGWLDDEPELIPDPEASKPDDWDNEMDGEWEAPLISNPKCENAPGCGKWKPPMIDNPNYRGKWKAPLINNPNYKGKWAPRRIPNPDYYEDLEPFKMTPVGALGIELWSISDGIYFDNFLITDNIEEADRISAETFDLKMAKLGSTEKNIFGKMIDFSNNHPWIYGVYVLVLAIPVVLIFVCCCAEDDKDALRKKTDESEQDDEVKTAEAPRNDDEFSNEIEEEEGEGEKEQEREEEKQNSENIAKEKSDSEVELSEDEGKTSTRLRKPRKE